jgi:hypothetical protein
MVLQTYKYFISRLGLAVFFTMVGGYLLLYFLHEVALPNVDLDDELILSGMALVSAFCGFTIIGLLGEQRFANTLYALEHIDRDADESATIERFEHLMALTRSAYFLPRKGKRFRDEVIRRFADYLLSISRESPEAMRIYLKAYLQNPGDVRYRAPLLAGLGRFADLGPEDLDLLLVLLRADDFKDAAVVNPLAELLLQNRRFSFHVEPVYIHALMNGHPRSKEITRFLLPFMLERPRVDESALRVYLSALAFRPPGADTLSRILGRVYCEEKWLQLHPELHRDCGKVFSALDQSVKDEIQRSVEVGESGAAAVHQLAHEQRHRIASFSDASKGTSGESGAGIWGRIWAYRLFWVGTAVGCLVAVALGQGLWKRTQQTPVVVAPPPVAPTPPRASHTPGIFYTVQVAAIPSQDQANKIMAKLSANGVEGLYVVRAAREKGGYWYKVRTKKFPRREQAVSFADDLVARKLVHNYFIFSIRSGPEKENKPREKPKAEAKPR